MNLKIQAAAQVKLHTLSLATFAWIYCRAALSAEQTHLNVVNSFEISNLWSRYQNN